MQIIEKKPVPMAVVKEALHKVEQTFGASNMRYEQKKVFAYTSKFSNLNAKDACELQEKLSKLNIGLSEEQIVKICDILPETNDMVRAIFGKDKFKYEEEKIKEIIDCVLQYK